MTDEVVVDCEHGYHKIRVVIGESSQCSCGMVGYTAGSGAWWVLDFVPDPEMGLTIEELTELSNGPLYYDNDTCSWLPLVAHG